MSVLSEVDGCPCGDRHLMTPGGLAALEQVTAGLDPASDCERARRVVAPYPGFTSPATD